jgi:hypothetical protein
MRERGGYDRKSESGPRYCDAVRATGKRGEKQVATACEKPRRGRRTRDWISSFFDGKRKSNKSNGGIRGVHSRQLATATPSRCGKRSADRTCASFCSSDLLFSCPLRLQPALSLCTSYRQIRKVREECGLNRLRHALSQVARSWVSFSKPPPFLSYGDERSSRSRRS